MKKITLLFFEESVEDLTKKLISQKTKMIEHDSKMKTEVEKLAKQKEENIVAIHNIFFMFFIGRRRC